VYGSTRSESRTFRYASRMPARRSACLAATTYNAGIRSYIRERSRRPAWAKPRLAATTSTLTHRSTHSENDRGPSHGDQPVWPRRPTTPGPTTHVSAPSVPRTTTNPRMGEALFGRQELVADAPLHRFRRRSRTHPWAKPCLAGDDLHTHTPLYSFQERSQTHAWAKPCLAGRPTALVRTQPPETNTSRGRPSGMELPDYPVMATLPTPWDQDGPALPLPARSFSVLVPHYGSRRPSLRRACAQSHPYRDRRYRGFR
jgi:hypothetical protein